MPKSLMSPEEQHAISGEHNVNAFTDSPPYVSGRSVVSSLPNLSGCPNITRPHPTPTIPASCALKDCSTDAAGALDQSPTQSTAASEFWSFDHEALRRSISSGSCMSPCGANSTFESLETASGWGDCGGDQMIDELLLADSWTS